MRHRPSAAFFIDSHPLPFALNTESLDARVLDHALPCCRLALAELRTVGGRNSIELRDRLSFALLLASATRIGDARGVGILPVRPASSTGAVFERFGRALGGPLPIPSAPQSGLNAMGLFSAPMKESAEMTYQWRQPFVVDDAKLRAALGVVPTAWEVASTEAVAWAREAYGPNELCERARSGERSAKERKVARDAPRGGSDRGLGW